jgi:hypothetical protein
MNNNNNNKNNNNNIDMLKINLSFFVYFKEDFIENPTNNNYSIERFTTTVENSLIKGSIYNCLSIRIISLTLTDKINLDMEVNKKVKFIYNNVNYIHHLFDYIHAEACDKILYKDQWVLGLDLNFVGLSMDHYELPISLEDNVGTIS